MSNQYIDRLNYFNDPRVRTTAPAVTLEIEHESGEIESVELPTIWQICEVCNGEGRHSNPSIDAGGISAEAFLEDQDFYDDYMSGIYDVSCNCCGGSGKVKAPDYDALTTEQREALEAEQMANEAYEAERRAELIMGC